MQVTPLRLQFDLGSHLAPVGEIITQNITLGNRGKKDVLFQIQAPKSHKCDVVILPNSGVVKAVINFFV